MSITILTAIIEFVPMGEALTDPKKLDEIERELQTELEDKKYEVVGESSFVVKGGLPTPTLFTYRLWAVSDSSALFTNPIKMRRQLEEICEELDIGIKKSTAYLLPGNLRSDSPGKFVLYAFSSRDAAVNALISVTESEIDRYLGQRK